MLIDFVTQTDDIVLDAQTPDEVEFGHGRNTRSGIHRCVEKDHACSRRERRLECHGIEFPLRRFKRDIPGDGAGPLDHRRIGVVERFKQHHLVAWIEQGKKAVRQCLRRPRCDNDFALPVVVEIVEAPRVGCDGLAEFGKTGHGRVLVRALDESSGRDLANVPGAVLVGKPLTKIDGSMLKRQARHDFEHRGAEVCHDCIGRPHVTSAGPNGPCAPSVCATTPSGISTRAIRSAKYCSMVVVARNDRIPCLPKQD